MQRLIMFILWSYSKLFRSDFQKLQTNNVLSTSQIFKVIVRHHELLEGFVEFLDKQRSLSTSSQRNYLSDIFISVQWFFLNKQSESSLCDAYVEDSLILQRWSISVKNILKSLNKVLTIERAKGNSLQECVYNAEYPEGGIQQLQQCILDDMDFVLSFIDSEECIYFIDKTLFLKFMRILYSSIYVFGVQGRLAGSDNIY